MGNPRRAGEGDAELVLRFLNWTDGIFLTLAAAVILLLGACWQS
jgi:hypothetical protein